MVLNTMIKKMIDRIARAALLSPVHSQLESPLQLSTTLSRATKCRVYLKRDDLLPTWSSSARGAMHWTAVERRRSNRDNSTGSGGQRFVTAENGTAFAQGLAYASTALPPPIAVSASPSRITVCVPSDLRKQQRDDLLSSFGESGVSADLVDCDGGFAAAVGRGQEIVASTGGSFVHPFDDEHVVAGFGTCAIEMLKQSSGELDEVFVSAAGGCGLISGVAASYQAFAPDQTRVWAVEMEGGALSSSLEAGARVTFSEQRQTDTFVSDVSSIGRLNFKVCNEAVAGVVTVSTDEVCAAIKDVFESTRVVLEPQGAMAVAGLKRWQRERGAEGKNLAAVLSGACIEFDRLRFVAERADEDEFFLGVSIPEEPGSFHNLYTLLSPRNVTEFSYRMQSGGSRKAEGKNRAHVLLSFQALASSRSMVELSHSSSSSSSGAEPDPPSLGNIGPEEKAFASVSVRVTS